MMDLIDRQVAIETVLRHGEIENHYTDLYYDGYCDGVYDSADILKDMPSAQPEIIRCKNCRWFAGEGMYCTNNILTQFDHFFCYYGERKEDKK